MRKLFTLVAAFAAFLSVSAQDVYYVDLCCATYDSINSTTAQWKFTNTDIILEPAGGRSYSVLERQGYSNALNFKNNTNQVLQLGDNKLYAIEFFGFSQGDNWEYLLAYGMGENAVGDFSYEWVDPIGKDMKDNATIIQQAAYPVDPCVISDSYKAGESYATAYPAEVFNETGLQPTSHTAGYKFATIDFGQEPYEGDFQFIFSGNNQMRAALRLWIKPYDASKADAIRSVKAQMEDGVMYDILGRPVNEGYKGIVIMNGQKFMLR